MGKQTTITSPRLGTGNKSNSVGTEKKKKKKKISPVKKAAAMIFLEAVYEDTKQ